MEQLRSTSSNVACYLALRNIKEEASIYVPEIEQRLEEVRKSEDVRRYFVLEQAKAERSCSLWEGMITFLAGGTAGGSTLGALLYGRKEEKRE